MPTAVECVCCCEIEEVDAVQQQLDESTTSCITLHPGFASVCLDLWVLQTAYHSYRQQYGEMETAIHK